MSECLRCQQLSAVIDELSDLLSKFQRSRRRYSIENRQLRNLLIIDMEDQHFLATGDNPLDYEESSVGGPSEGQG